KYLNFYSEKSEITTINKHSGKNPVSVTPVTFKLLNKAINISKLSEGAFDITLGVISRLYDFANKKHPSKAEIERLLPLVGYRNITLQPKLRVVYLSKAGMMIDPGGITKGYAADLAVMALKKQGIKAALVAIAGDIKGYGLKPDGRPWLVGIRDPRSKNRDEIFATVELKDLAISTSGDYERFFIENGVRYHHILDPKTGLPASGVISVTVIGPDATYTDALATAIFVKGVKQGLKLAKKAGYKAIIVDKNGKIHKSTGLSDGITFLKENIEVVD
ncbi:MAG: FAD:protein FMN transferase, partial [Nitrospirae bacterium]|nr:FAD:protein FMN transferase [Nitrospirota bacterium]